MFAIARGVSPPSVVPSGPSEAERAAIGTAQAAVVDALEGFRTATQGPPGVAAAAEACVRAAVLLEAVLVLADCGPHILPDSPLAQDFCGRADVLHARMWHVWLSARYVFVAGLALAGRGDAIAQADRLAGRIRPAFKLIRRQCGIPAAARLEDSATFRDRLRAHRAIGRLLDLAAVIDPTGFAAHSRHRAGAAAAVGESTRVTVLASVFGQEGLFEQIERSLVSVKDDGSSSSAGSSGKSGVSEGSKRSVVKDWQVALVELRGCGKRAGGKSVADLVRALKAGQHPEIAAGIDAELSAHPLKSRGGNAGKPRDRADVIRQVLRWNNLEQGL